VEDVDDEPSPDELESPSKGRLEVMAIIDDDGDLENVAGICEGAGGGIDIEMRLKKKLKS